MRPLAVALCLSLLAGVGRAQVPSLANARSGMAYPSRVDPAVSVQPGSHLLTLQPAVAHTEFIRVARDPWWVPVASALLPGAGQFLLGQDRALAYLAVESFTALQYLRDRRVAREQRDEYRGLARRVARSRFGDGGLPDGGFEYYELMQRWVESGVYDQVPGGTVDPETDDATFNGFIWRLARETFWENPLVPPAMDGPAYQRALAFYMRRAVRPEYRWSWRNAQLEQDLFVRTIDASNRAFRRSIADLGVLLANHALSTVDAYVSLRLRWRGGSAPHASPALEARLPWPIRREDHPFAR